MMHLNSRVSRHALGAVIAVSLAQGALAAPPSSRIGKLEADNRDLRDQLSQLQALRAQLEALQAKVDAQATTQQAAQQAAQAQIEQVQETTKAAQAQVAAVPETVKTALDKARKADKFYYKGITITPGGFAEMTGVYRQHNMASDVGTNFNAIPFDNSRVGQVSEGRLSARHSRFSLLAQGDVNPTTHLAFYGELDLLGAAQTANSNESNSFTPRLRHLYATVDLDRTGMGLHVLAGQTWSLVTMNSKGITPRNEVQPPSIDPQYVPGYVWARQPQVRVTGDFLDHALWLAVSAENPQTTFYGVGTPAGATAGTAGTAAPLPGTLVNTATAGSSFNSANTLSLNQIPDFVGKVAYEAKFGERTLHLEAFGIYRQFSYRVDGDNQHASGGGYGGGVIFSLVPKLLDVQFSAAHGKGLGRYGTSQLPDATFSPTGAIRPITETILLGGMTAHPTKQLDVYVFAGQEQEDREAFTTATGLAYGYGNPLYTNFGCDIEGSTVCNGNTRRIRQLTGGLWDRIMQGPYGRVQVGLQYSLTERKAFTGVGGAPSQTQNIGFVSVRYYPF